MMPIVEENFDQHVQNVVALLYETEDQEIIKVKQSVGVYIRNFVREFLSKLGADELIPSSLQNLMNVFYTVIVSPIVEVPVKRHIYLVFEQLLQIYLSVEEDQEKITEFYSQLFNHSVLQLQSNQNGNLSVTKGVLFICQAALQSIRTDKQLSKIFEGLAVILCKVVNDCIINLRPYLQQIS
jgi:hypothetical protein